MEFMPRRLSRDESDDVARRIQASIEERGWGFWAVEVKGGDARVADEGVAVRAAGEGVGAGAVADGGAARVADEGVGVGAVAGGGAARGAAFIWVCRIGFERLRLQQIVAFTVPLNRRSIGVMERIGMSRDPADDFDHPKLPAGHPLRRHVLYRIDRNEWLNRHGFIDRM